MIFTKINKFKDILASTSKDMERDVFDMKDCLFYLKNENNHK
jgi:hypothetical protein